MRRRTFRTAFPTLLLTFALAGAFGVSPALAETDDAAGASTEAEVDAKAEAEAKARAEAVKTLTADYLAAVENYQAMLDRQRENAEAITRLEADIEDAEGKLARAQAHLEEASVEMYKNGIQPGQLLETVMAAPSLSESVTLYEDYTRLEAHRKQQCEDARRECEGLRANLTSLEEQREALAAEVVSTRKAVADAKDALRKAAHLDGQKFHQTQGNGVNCGATAFIVGVNILLGENAFTDNVKVWESEAFARDSTINLVEKGTAWLKDNNLADVIDFKYVKGDIHKADELRAELEQGNVVVISSGAGSEWQRIDAADAKKGLYPGGHWICFYGYSEGVFYANDSAVAAKRGAGCPYTEAQLQQWLDGRSYHVACVLSKADDPAKPSA